MESYCSECRVIVLCVKSQHIEKKNQSNNHGTSIGIITSGKCQFNILKYTTWTKFCRTIKIHILYDVQIIHSTYPWIWFIFMSFHLILFYLFYFMFSLFLFVFVFVFCFVFFLFCDFQKFICVYVLFISICIFIWVLFRFISFHFISFHFISFHFISLYFILFHLIFSFQDFFFMF